MAALRPTERAAAARYAERLRAAPGPRTRAEASGYAETSRYADVVAFLDAVAGRAPDVVRVTSMGASGEGRAIPLVDRVAPGRGDARGGAPPRAAGGVRAGEHPRRRGRGEGGAADAAARPRARPRRNVLDSLVLVAVPIYNADGNERVGPQAGAARSRTAPSSWASGPTRRGSTSTATT
jgi:hypothetical protein